MFDFLANINFISSDEFSLNASVNFIPNFQINASVNFIGSNSFTNYSLPANVNFNNNYSYNLPASINFVQSNSQDFPVNLLIQSSIVQQNENYVGEKNLLTFLTINNNLLGGGNIPIYISSGSLFTELTYVLTDATGYFEFNNLVPGTYTITPFLSGLNFFPLNQEITISNFNVQLHFSGNGILTNQIKTTSNLPTNIVDGCFINQSDGNAGTFSIEGFVNLSDSSIYTDIMTVITDEVIASNFRKTVVNK